MKKILKKKDLAPVQSRIRTLLFREKVISGTLNVQKRGNALRYTLTDKVAGKTRCVYVPVKMAPTVQQWVENWKELKLLLLQISALARAELTGEITQQPNKKHRGGAMLKKSSHH